jgi:hypothetical protein
MTLPAARSRDLNGRVNVEPSCRLWPGMAAENSRLAGGWEFDVAGVPVAEVREQARRDTLQASSEYMQLLGLAPAAAPADDSMIVMSGHQPEFYHPGIWIKNFLLQELARGIGARAVNVEVDTDSFSAVSFTVPCIDGNVRRCSEVLTAGEPGLCYSCISAPEADAVEGFVAACRTLIDGLPVTGARSSFARYAECLTDSLGSARSLSELMTSARRRFEGAVSESYDELPVTRLARTSAWALFAADIAFNAERFASVHNAVLADYRREHRSRSVADPFPDLSVQGDRVELPLWVLIGGRRESVWAHRSADGVGLVAGDAPIASLGGDAGGGANIIRELDVTIVPKAMALTLFVRVFVADLFIHGYGGARYDEVTDGVCRRYFGIEPPSYVVASADIRLAGDWEGVSEEELAMAKDRLHRLDHNPDVLLGEIELEGESERERANALAAEKTALVAAISAPDADRKSLGIRIKQVNGELSALLAPLRARLSARVEELEVRAADLEVLSDRTYPFCLWDPADVASLAASAYRGE